MEKYVALLRGINVGGKNVIRMAELRECVEKEGFREVETYIQSGNVVFELPRGEKMEVGELESRLEKALGKAFEYKSTVVVRSREEIKKVLEQVPAEWKKLKDIRCYIAFVKAPITVAEVAEQVEPREGVDQVKVGRGVVYLTTLMSGLTKSGFTKLIGKRIYKQVTMRNYRTTMKIGQMVGNG